MPTTASISSTRSAGSEDRICAQWATRLSRNASSCSASISRPAAARCPPKRARLLGARAKRAEEVEPGDAAAGALAAPVGVQGDQDRRAQVALGHPRGADADDAWVPALAPQDDRGAGLALRLELSEEAVCVGQDLALGLAPVVVCAVELDCDLARPLGIVAQEKLHCGVRAVEATGSVDPRREAEADVRLVNALGRDVRDLHERAQAEPRRAAHLIEPTAHERAVLAEERHHVGDGGQRDQVEIALGPLDAQKGARRPCGRRPPRRGRGTGIRETTGWTIGQSGSSAPGWWWSVTTTSMPSDVAYATSSTEVIPQSAVIRRPVPRSASRSIVVAAEAVAVLDAPGDEPVALRADLAQGADEDRGRGGAVDVVVAVDRDRLLRGDRTPDRRDRSVHPGELGRVVALVGGEELASALDRAVTAAHQCDGDGLRNLERAGNLGRLVVRVRSKAKALLALGPAGRVHRLRLGAGGDGIAPVPRPGGRSAPRTGRNRARGECRSAT